MNDYFLLKKEVDRSVLAQGLTIPAAFQDIVYKKVGIRLSHGQKARIKITISDQVFWVDLINQAFDRVKYYDHCDVLQIRYSPKSDIACYLREVFNKTYNTINDYIKYNGKSKSRIALPENEREYLVIYATDIPGELYCDCISYSEQLATLDIRNKISETEYEHYVNETDENASIIEKYSLVKVRRISKSIGNSLKVKYGYRCQICGEYIGEKYGSKLIHAHHIIPFARSLNNNADNIMIVCPNHHGIIHDMNPLFNREKKEFIYQNGFHEPLAVNYHL